MRHFFERLKCFFGKHEYRIQLLAGPNYYYPPFLKCLVCYDYKIIKTHLSTHECSKGEQMKCKQCDLDIPMNHAQVGGVHMSCEDKYVHDKSELMIKLRPESGMPWLILNLTETCNFILEADDESEFIIKRVYLTKHEVDSMPEFEGW